MIKPTVGRVVWFTPARQGDKRSDKSQPLAAIVTYVHSDRCVNLSVFEQNGAAQTAGYITVKLLQEEHGIKDEPPESGHFAEWMPYQVGQAARTEAAERKLAGETR